MLTLNLNTLAAGSFDQPPQVVDALTQAEADHIEATTSESLQKDAVITQAENAQISASRLEKMLEERPEDVGMAQVASAAVEALRSVLRMPQKSIGAESMTPMGAKKQVKALHDELGMRVILAKEGLWSDIKYGWGSFWTSQDGLIEKKGRISAAYDTKGSNSEMLTDKPYAKLLAGRINSSKITADQVIATLSTFKSNLTNAKLIRSLEQLDELALQIAKSVSGWSIRPDDEDRIRQAQMAVSQALNSIYEDISVPVKADYRPTIMAATPEEKRELMGLLDEIYNNHGVDQALRSLSKSCSMYEKVGSETRTRMVIVTRYDEDGNSLDPELATQTYEEIKSERAEIAIGDIYQVANKLHGILGMRFHYVYAAVKYIEESTAK